MKLEEAIALAKDYEQYWKSSNSIPKWLQAKRDDDYVKEVDKRKVAAFDLQEHCSAHFPEAVRLLELLEWRPGEGIRYCPRCHESEKHGHADGCDLGDFLKKAKEVKT